MLRHHKTVDHIFLCSLPSSPGRYHARTQTNSQSVCLLGAYTFVASCKGYACSTFTHPTSPSAPVRFHLVLIRAISEPTNERRFHIHLHNYTIHLHLGKPTYINSPRPSSSIDIIHLNDRLHLRELPSFVLCDKNLRHQQEPFTRAITAHIQTSKHKQAGAKEKSTRRQVSLYNGRRRAREESSPIVVHHF